MRSIHLALGLFVLGPGASVAAAEAYHDHAGLSAALQALADGHPRACALESIGASREGRAIWALRAALPGEVAPDDRPALLITANLDGDHLIGSEVALDVARRLLERVAAADEAAVAFLSDHVLYVVPRVNPDAAERYFAPVKTDRRRNLRPVDGDRDGARDEDGPDDLDGDGLITTMRVYDPEEADLMADPDEPRLNAVPESDEGERAEFTIYTEGRDDDGDGAFNEDALGGVDLNLNFMHGYPAHADGAGPFQVSEPESRALLEYVLAHQNIAVVLAYGRHDNLVNAPESKSTHPSGAPKEIHSEDAGLYERIGKRFKEITGQQRAPDPPADGAFFAWAYAQFGVPAFATPIWTRPQPEKGEDQPDQPEAGAGGRPGPGPAGAAVDEGLTPSGIGDISQETIDELRAAAEDRGFTVTDEMVSNLTPRMVEGFARRMGIEVRRVAGEDGGRRAARNEQDAAWLTYSDEQRGGAGFVDWESFDHPQLEHRVEIGGWVPYFRTNPPAEAIPALAGKQVEFVLDLASRLPRVTLTEPEVDRLAPGLYELKVALVNDGYFPTATAMAVRNRRARPHVVRLSVPEERLITGRRVNLVWSVPGSGGREAFRWILKAEDGAELTVTVYSEKYGEFERTVRLRPAAPRKQEEKR